MTKPSQPGPAGDSNATRPVTLLQRRDLLVRGLIGFSAALATTLLAAKDAKAGYGACSSCSCPGFSGSGDSCGTCGHHYDSHW